MDQCKPLPQSGGVLPQREDVVAEHDHLVVAAQAIVGSKIRKLFTMFQVQALQVLSAWVSSIQLAPSYLVAALLLVELHEVLARHELVGVHAVQHLALRSLIPPVEPGTCGSPRPGA